MQNFLKLAGKAPVTDIMLEIQQDQEFWFDRECVTLRGPRGWTKESRSTPSVRKLVLNLMRMVHGENLGFIQVCRVLPGAQWMSRAIDTIGSQYRVTLQTGPGVVSMVGEEGPATQRIHAEDGDIHYVSRLHPHMIANDGSRSHIDLVAFIESNKLDD